MRLVMKLTILAVMIATAAPTVFAGDSASALKKELQKGMNSYAAAFKKMDVAAVEKIIRKYFAPDFYQTDANGNKSTLEDWINQTKQHMKMTKKVESIAVTVHTLKLSGDSASTTESMKAALIIVNPNDPSKTARLSVDANWQAIYKKVNGKWMAMSAKATGEKFLLNGKPWNPANPQQR